METVFDKINKIILLIIAMLCIICITPSVYAAKKIAVTKISLNKTSLTLEPGKSDTLKATIAPNNASNKKVTWSGGTKNITVKNGKVTISKNAKAGEKTTIIVTSNENAKIQAKCIVTVKEKSIPVKSISLTGAKTGLIGTPIKLTATIKPDNATNKNIKWETSNEQIATVSKGTVTGKKEGTVTIKATTEDGKKSAKIKIKINSPEIKADKVTLKGTKERIRVGGTVTFTAELTSKGSKDKVNQKVTWTSNKPNIAKVDSKGLITGVSAGKAKITATSVDGSNKKASFTITVVQQVTGLKIANKVSKMVVGDTHKLDVKILPEGVETESKKIKYLSSNPAVVSVTSGGKLKALKKGTATITASIKVTEMSSSEKTATFTVEVINERKATSLKISQTFIKVNKGKTIKITPIVAPADTTDEVTFQSKSTGIAKVDANGVVTGVKKGSTKIIVKAGKLSQTCNVTVTDETYGVDKGKIDNFAGAAQDSRYGIAQNSNSSWRGNCAAVSEYYIERLYGRSPDASKVKKSYGYPYGKTDYAGYKVDNAKNLKSAIDSGKLARIHVKGYSGEHWVVVIGYEGDGKDFDDYYFLDSWNGVIYKGKNRSTIKGLYNGKWDAKVLT